MGEAESQKDAYLEGTVVSDSSDSPILAHLAQLSW